MSDELFTVYQFFADDSHERVRDGLTPDAALKLATQLARSVGGRIGTTRRIIVTDALDCTVFEWQFGRGVTWPTLDEGSSNAQS